MQADAGSIADWVTAVAAVLALCFGVVQISAAAKLRDLDFINSHRERLGERWRAYRKAIAGGDDSDFEFGELLDCYERTCFVLNHRMVGPEAYKFMRDHVLEVILILVSDEPTLAKIKSFRSGPRTYEEIVTFCSRNRGTVDEIYTNLLDLALTPKDAVNRE